MHCSVTLGIVVECVHAATLFEYGKCVSDSLFYIHIHIHNIAKLYHLYELLFSDEGCMHGTPWA